MASDRKKTFPLRLSETMRHEAEILAHLDGVSLNQFISLAVAEKIARLDRDGIGSSRSERRTSGDPD
jgi:hypothetical protein